MTTGSALAIAAGPTAAALLVLGLTDPKRRRVRGEAPAPALPRRVAFGVLAACGILSGTAGAPALLIFVVAATVAGWAVTTGLASLAPSASSALDAWLTGGAALLSGGVRRHTLLEERSIASAAAVRAVAYRQVSQAIAWSRSGPLPHAALLLALVICAGASLMTWRAASHGAAEAQRLADLQAFALSRQTETEVRPALPCLEALVSSLNADQALEDVLAGRTTSLSFKTPSPADGGDVSLQTCLLAGGIDDLEVEPTPRPSVHRFILDAASVRPVRDALVTVLTRYDELVAVAFTPPNATHARLPSDVWALLALVSRNLHRAETRHTAERFPHLRPWSGAW